MKHRSKQTQKQLIRDFERRRAEDEKQQEEEELEERLVQRKRMKNSEREHEAKYDEQESE